MQDAKRGAHDSNFLLSAPEGIRTLEDVYGPDNLSAGFANGEPGVKCITAAPELEGVIDTIPDLVKRGVVFSIGHRCVLKLATRHRN